MKKFILLLFMLVSILAHAVKIDGIYYELNGSSATVVKPPYSSYQGDITIPDSVTYLDKSYKVTSIGVNAFGSSQITSINISSESLLSIGSNAFSYCSNLTSVNISGSENLLSIGSSAFANCANLTSVNISGMVTNIASNTFAHCSSLVSISIPESVTSIGYEAFYGCSSLVSISIPECVTNIEGEAFQACSSLASFKIPENVTNIGSYAFYGCSSLESIVIPSKVTNIGSYAFKNCGLKSLVVSEGVKSIGSYGSSIFSDCTSLLSISLPSTLTSIPDFTGCSNVETLIYNCGLSAYDVISPFKTSLKELVIGGNKKKITKGYYSSGDMFYECTSLKSLTIANSVESIELDAFKDCPIEILSIDNDAYCDSKYFGKNITELYLGEHITMIGNEAFKGCTKLKSVNIPDNVMTLGQLAFQGCSSVVSVKVGDNVEVIPNGCFAACTLLDNVTLGSHVMNINTRAFAGDRRISAIYTSTFLPPTCADAEVFDSYVYQSADLYVPTVRNALDRYKKDAVWGKFDYIQEKDFEALPVYITINGIEGGKLKLKAEKYRSYTFVLEPETDWILHSVMLNEEDVTRNVDDMTYTTPAITEDCELYVVFEQDPEVGVRSISSTGNMRVRAFNGMVEFENDGDEDAAGIFTVDGKFVKSISIPAGNSTVSLEGDNIYVIKTTKSVYKVAM